MKLWLLRPIEGVSPNLWEPWYDKAFGFVIRAETEEAARGMTKGETGDELNYRTKVNPWLDPAFSTCVELTQDGKPQVIIRDFAAA